MLCKQYPTWHLGAKNSPSSPESRLSSSLLPASHPSRPSRSQPASALESHVTLLVVDDDLVAQARMNAYFFKGRLPRAAGRRRRVLLATARPGRSTSCCSTSTCPVRTACRWRASCARDASIGIILVTSRNDDVDKIVGLEVGADDYVTKPFNPRGVARPRQEPAAAQRDASGGGGGQPALRGLGAGTFAAQAARPRGSGTWR